VARAFGSCPTYEVTLRRSGSAIWSGHRFVERLGDYGGKFEPDDFLQLAGFIERCGFFDWEDEYLPSVEISDHPKDALEVTRGRLTKSVTQTATVEPADFWVIAGLIDAIAAGIRWAPTTTPR
jgi:hypothetical protein